MLALAVLDREVIRQAEEASIGLAVLAAAAATLHIAAAAVAAMARRSADGAATMPA
jgi:hypothetical protein